MKISQERQNMISRLIAAGSPKSDWCQNAEEDQFWDIKVSEYAAAKDPSTPAFILAKLAQDAVENLRWRVARNQSTPIEVLNELVGDKNEYVNMFALGNLFPRIPPSELFENDQDGTSLRVKLYLANDSQTPVEVLNMLAQKSESSVLVEVARNPSTRVELLRMLAEKSECSVLVAVAGNPSTPVEVLKMLAQQSDILVLLAVAGNRSTPLEVRNILAQQSGIWVKAAPAINPSTHDEVPNPNVHERSWEKF